MPYVQPGGHSVGMVPFPITTRRYHIASGESGNWATVARARRLIHGPEGSSDFVVRQTAVDVTWAVPHDDAASLVAALKRYLGTIPFIPDDFGNQELFSPRLSILMHQQQRQRIACASIAVLGAALAKSIGLQPAFMLLQFEGSPISTHIYAVARDAEVAGPWYDLDATNRFQHGSRAAPVARWRMVAI